MQAFELEKKERGVSMHLPITHLNSPTVFETSSGQVGAVLRVAGVSCDTALPDTLNRLRASWHQALVSLGECFAVYEHVVRKRLNMSLSGEFSDPFSQQVNDQYHQQFQGKQLYSNTLYLTLLYKGVDSGKVGKSLSFLQKLTNRVVNQAREQFRAHAMSQLEQACSQLMASLSEYSPARLGERDTSLGYSEVLQFFAQFVNGFSYDEPIRFCAPKQTMALNSRGVAPPAAKDHLYPDGNIAEFLPTKRLFFGECIEYQQGEQSRYALMLATKRYGSDSSAMMLHPVLQLDAELVVTNSFFIEPAETGLKRVQQQRIKLSNANDAAASQQSALDDLTDDLASERCLLGYHHNTVMVLGASPKHVKRLATRVIKIYNDLGYAAVVETLGLEPAFWAQIPGNQRYIARSALITSQNFVDFAPLYNAPTGYRDRNHLGSAVTVMETSSRTPLFFNYHAKGSGDKNDLTPGHTTIIGGNGSGKTVFMGFMDAQMGRYGGRSFFFDRDRGMEIYVRACGGSYSIISPDHPKDVAFNPFWLDDTPKNRSFLKTWLAELVKKDGEVELPTEVEQPLHECVDYAYDSLDKVHRHLSSVTQLLPLDFPRWNRLHKWLRGNDTRSDGEYAYLFDHEYDHVPVEACKVGFDMTHLMSEPKSVMTAVCMYLVHRIQASFDGQRVSLYFDEGWQFLDHPYWKGRLRQDLPTWRKLNAHIVLATQSPDSVVNSALSAQFLDNAATNIFFCNERANFDQHYRHFGLSEREFRFIKETPSQYRLLLYKQSQDSAVAKLNLSGMPDALAVFSANAATLRVLDSVRATYGDDPMVWLPHFHRERVNA